MKNLITFLLILIISLFSISCSNPVVNASEGVFRIWITSDLTSALDSEVIQILKKNPYKAVEIKGNQLILFYYQGRVYGVTGHGSGFAINNDHVVTNHHVIDTILKKNDIGFIVIGKEGNKLLLAKVTKIVWHSDRKDLAIIKVNNLDASPLTFAKTKSIKQTDKVASIGYPGDSDDVQGGIEDEVGYFSTKIHFGTFSTFRENAVTKVNVLEHDAAISAGNSGGPLVNECGHVVGVNSSGHVSNNNVLFSVALRELIPEIESLGLSYKKTWFGCSGIGKYLLIIILSLVVLVAILSFLFIYKTGKTAEISNFFRKLIGEKPSKPASEKPNKAKVIWQVDDRGREFRYDNILGIVYKDEKPSQKKATTSSINIEVSVDKQPQGSINADLNKSIIIGRSSNSDISVNSQYVSGQHAKVSLEPKGIFITDLNSSNGTFINNSQISGKNKYSGGQIKLAGLNNNIEVKIKSDIDNKNISTTQHLIVTLDGYKIAEKTLDNNQSITIGRDAACDIAINSSIVSSKHLKISHEGSDIYATDLNSMNGTFINGRRISGKVKANNVKQIILAGPKSNIAVIVSGGNSPAIIQSNIDLVPISNNLPKITLKHGSVTTIGRSKENSVVINNSLISSKHARLYTKGNGVIIVEDLNSTNGIYVNNLNNRIASVALTRGQKLILAHKDITYTFK